MKLAKFWQILKRQRGCERGEINSRRRVRDFARLLFTMPANRRRCSFAVSLHGLRRHHYRCNRPRIVRRPRVGEIWLRGASVTLSLVKC